MSATRPDLWLPGQETRQDLAEPDGLAGQVAADEAITRARVE